jgi:hypothetical protein
MSQSDGRDIAFSFDGVHVHVEAALAMAVGRM